MCLWLRMTLVLIATIWFCPSARALQDVDGRARETLALSLNPSERLVLSAPFSRGESSSPFSPFRLRRKAVLEESQTQVIDSADLGPASSPSPCLAVVSRALTPGPSLASLPLRC
jgi:hypothetical protein